MSAVRTVFIRPRGVASVGTNGNESTLELDSHADTSCLGGGALELFDHESPVNVQGYDPALGAKQFRTITGAMAFTHPYTGRRYHIVIHQAVSIPDLDHHLLCPMQCRAHGVTVNECPRMYCDEPTEESHSIVTPDEYGGAVVLPLFLKGVTSSLNVESLSQEEWDRHDCPRITLTDRDLTWDPNSSVYEDQEENMVDYQGHVYNRNATARRPLMVINQVCTNTCEDAADISADDNFGEVLQSHVNVSDVNVSKFSGTNPDSEFGTRYNNIRSRKSKQVDSELLAKRWGIDSGKASRTVRQTTQRGLRTTLHPTMSRRYPTNDRMMRYDRLPHTVFTDTLKAGTKSKRGNLYGQAYGTSFGWARCHPMKLKSCAHDSVSLLFKRDGVPPAIVADNAKEESLGKFAAKCREADCHLVNTEPYSPWQNCAEGTIKELKKGSARRMLKSGTPKRLWDHCIEYEALIRSHTAHDIFALEGQVPETLMKGDTPDISHLCEYEWFQWVKYHEPTLSYPQDKMVIGRYLGPAIDVGSALTHKVLKSNGEFVSRTTVRPWTLQEEADPVDVADAEAYMVQLKESLGPACIISDFPEQYHTPENEYYADDDQEDGFEGSPDELPPTPEVGDNYVGAQLELPRGDAIMQGRVVKRARDNDGNPIGRSSTNPILDSREYVVEFEDGTDAELAANVIAQSMYAQCDPEGNKYVLLDSITDYRRGPTALSHADQKVTRANGRTFMRRSTAGWKLCVTWKDGSTTWEKLSDLKESHPVITAEYAVSQSLEFEPAFNWWVPFTLKKRNRIISLVKKRNARYLKRDEKFGIKVPKSVKEAYLIDEENGNTFWADAIAKEMKNVRVAFKILDDGEVVPRDHQWIRCHMIFDVKMEDFRRKARFVAGGHMTKAPATMTYASVVSRETVRIALTLAALNGLQVKCGDVLNAYITAPVTEKIWTTLGPEFGSDAGKKAIIVRALYGLKSSGAAFRKHLGECMSGLGYVPCLADPDLWLKEQSRPDGSMYYSYILCYVDDILVVHHDARPVLDKIDKYMKLKEGSVGDPDIYLGAKLKKVQLDNDVWCWSLSPSKYVQEAVRNCEKKLKEKYPNDYSLIKNAPNPFPLGYEPEMDVSPVLEPTEASYYQTLIGVMRWMVELGRVDIAVEVSQLSSFLAMPRQGHLVAALHIMSYLKVKHNSRLVLDPSYPVIDYKSFNDNADWTQSYGKVEEAMPTNAPKPLGKEVELRMFVDSDHAGDKATRRSRTGYMIFLNMSMIDWMSKKQATVEGAVFGAEFVAMKQGVETLRGIRYKLRMMGVEIAGPSYVYGDNMSVINNTSKPESCLKKKSNSICYHFVREAVAMKECLTTHIPTLKNFADLLTKVLSGKKRRDLVGGVLYDIYDYD